MRKFRVVPLLIFVAGALSCSPPEDTVSLRAGSLEITFDLTKNGGIVSLRNGAVDVVSAGFERPLLFKIGIVEGVEERWASSLDFEEFSHEELDGTHRFRYSQLPGSDVVVSLTVAAEDEYVSFRSEVEFGPDGRGSSLLFPYVNGYESLSGDPERDWFLLPELCGYLIPNPPKRLRQANSSALGALGYPGQQGFQLNALYNDDGGFAMYAADSDSHPKRLTLWRDPATDSIGWSVLHYFDETPGFRFRQGYDVRIQQSGPTWYDACDVYAAWSRKQSWMQKQVPRREWLDQLPPQANVHNNHNWTRTPPAWFANHQAELNGHLGNRPVINLFHRWERYGMWIAPDSFPPLGGEAAMLEAGRKIRGLGGHLIHLFSAGQYWLHQDISEEYFEDELMKMAVLPRGPADRESLSRTFPFLGQYVLTCPTSESYQAKLVHLVDKLADYSHDFISMDIWPAGQPRTCHSRWHDHPPGVGRWYVNANIELIKKMQKAAYAKLPEAVFGGEGMAEPYMPWMQATLMRSAETPLRRGRDGSIEILRAPIYDYLYGDQVHAWGGLGSTGLVNGRAFVALQLVRGDLLNMGDKLPAAVLNRAEMAKDRTKLVLLPEWEMQDKAFRAESLKYLVKANDLQQGLYRPFFAHGRGWRFPTSFAREENETEWRPLTIYSRDPAVGSLRHEGSKTILWALANGWEKSYVLRLKALQGRTILKSTLAPEPTTVEFQGGEFIEVRLDPLEIAFIEWE